MMTLEVPRRTAAPAEAWAHWKLSRTALSRFAARAQRAVRLEGMVDFLLTSDAAIRRINRDFRGKDKATDVLSFPAADEVRGKHAGDLAISLDTAKRQAREQGHALDTEVRVLLLHGLLHLAGMDHEVDNGEMAAREAGLREELGLPAGLIARTENAGVEERRSGGRSAAVKRAAAVKQRVRKAAR
jgi:probable rRNA maturation factor